MRINKSTPNLVNICIDKSEDGDIKGRYYHRYQKEPMNFANTIRLFEEMDGFYDALNFPQMTVRTRFFHGDEEPGKATIDKKKYVWENEEVAAERGKIGTFIVNVTSRLNASWQGQVTWAEEDITKEFRSMMELMVLIDNAVK